MVEPHSSGLLKDKIEMISAELAFQVVPIAHVIDVLQVRRVTGALQAMRHTQSSD
jgi:hypothetical protein